jgi:dTMP kinase
MATGESDMRGKLIVIEGLDGSGKATQSALLVEALQKQGKQVRKVSFPAYDSDSSALVKMYLSGQFGTDPGDVNAYAASSFYAVDRFASYKSDWGQFYQEGGIIVADRYTTSNAIHQCSKLPREDWDSYLHWLFDFEYHLMGIPAPDAVIYLQVDPAVSQKLMTGRYHGDESKKDIHESNLDYLARSRDAAVYCAEKLGWHSVKCHDDSAMRSIEDIHAEVAALAGEFV